MVQLVASLETQHDWSLILLVGVVCFLTSIAAITLFHRALATVGRARWRWLMPTAAAAGYGIWATHFVAMLAFSPGLPVGYDLLITLALLPAAALVAGAGFALAAQSRRRVAASAGGAIVGLAIAAMDYASMSALDVPGHIVWVPDLAAVSLLLGVAFGIAAVNVAARSRGLWSMLSGAQLLMLANLAHHFTGMGAMEIIPDPTMPITALALSPHALGITIASVAAALFGISLFASLASRSSQHLAETAIANMPQGICMYDRHQRVVIRNHRYAEIYGLSLDETKPGVALRDILEARVAQGTLGEIQGADFVEAQLAKWGQQETSAIIPLLDGRFIAVHTRQTSDGGAIGTHEDITERHLLNSKIAEQKQQLHTQNVQFDIAINTIPQGLCMFDGDSRLVICNERYMIMYGLSAEQAKPGTTLDEIVQRRMENGLYTFTEPEEYTRYYSSPVLTTLDWFQKLADGRVFAITRRPMEAGGWVATHEDVTEHHLLHSQIEEQNKLLRAQEASLRAAKEQAELSSKTKSEFLANMSHEIRTPLNGVLGMAQSLQNDALSPPQREKVAIILDSGNTLMTVLNDVLDLSKIEAGKLEISCIDGDLVKAVGRIRRLFLPQAEEKGLSIDFHCPADFAHWLHFDPVRVRQCVSNILSNAIKFTDTGTITIALSTEAGDGDNLISIAIADTGIGMTPDTMASLFSAFTQADGSTSRRFGGTGLGLTIARQLARMMGGDVAIASEAGMGSTFTFSFRAAAASRRGDDCGMVAEAIAPPMPDNRELRHARILLADDNAVNRQVIKLFLAPLGVTIAEAENGRVAMEKLAAERFDLVLLDIHMPVMDGRQTIKAIRHSVESWRTIPVIALTADAMTGDREKYLALGMDDYLSKPVDRNELHAKLIAMLERQGVAVRWSAATR